MWDLCKSEVITGQYLDVTAESRAELSVDAALAVVTLKAAKYTIERPLHLGAELADASPELVVSYSGYGLPLGEAFQLRDDVLGVFGDPKETGKPAGDDLREGKRTVLVATAAEAASPAEAAVLRRRLGDPALDAEGIDELREIIVRTGALRHVECLIESLTEQCFQALDAAPVADDAREVLRGLAVAATSRSV